MICRGCLSKSIIKNYVKESGQVKCPSNECSEMLSPMEMKQIVGEKQYTNLDNLLMENYSGQFTIQCSNLECQMRI